MDRQRFRETENIDEEQERKCAAGNHAGVEVDTDNPDFPLKTVCAYCGEELA
jgi:hypothetical protein